MDWLGLNEGSTSDERTDGVTYPNSRFHIHLTIHQAGTGPNFKAQAHVGFCLAEVDLGTNM